MALKTFYHGTVAAFLPQIQREGLRPEAKHAWKVHFEHYGELRPPSDGMGDGRPGVFVTLDKSHAIAYAQTRADYFQRNPGECFPFFSEKPDEYLFLSKDADAPILTTLPALLTLSIDTEKIKLSVDPDDTAHAMVTHAPIPKSAIIKVEKLEPKYDPKRYTSAVRRRIEDEAFTKAFGGLGGGNLAELFRTI
jgi:hypothetical protein